MRIGSGPRLMIQRLGAPSRPVRHRWRTDSYEARLARDWERIRHMPRKTAGDAKPVTTYLRYVPLGRWCRQVDAHGRCFGPRLQREADLPETTRVRIVQRKEEDLRSRMSRMLKAAHRFALRTE
jgi:hypothetical protein